MEKPGECRHARRKCFRPQESTDRMAQDPGSVPDGRHSLGDTMNIKPKVAIVLFNLGGPDRPEAVRPFLRNLFTDPAILRVPGLFRGFLAWLIARRRVPV